MFVALFAMVLNVLHGPVPQSGGILLHPVRFMLQGSNAQAVASWQQSWRLNGTYPFVSFSVATPTLWNSVETRAFDSFGSLEDALAQGSIAPGVSVLIYDNERWPLTPPQEQADPAYYEEAFCAAAHSYGYKCMTAPAFDLVVPTAGQTQYQSYFSQNFPQFSAQYADFYAIQAQGYQNNEALYAMIVQQAQQAALSAAPHPKLIKFLASLSTNPNPQQGQPTVAILSADIADTRAYLNGGFWLNIPTPGIACPKCAPTDIGLAEGLISAVNR